MFHITPFLDWRVSPRSTPVNHKYRSRTSSVVKHFFYSSEVPSLNICKMWTCSKLDRVANSDNTENNPGQVWTDHLHRRAVDRERIVRQSFAILTRTSNGWMYVIVFIVVYVHEMDAETYIRSCIGCARRKFQNFAIFGAKHPLAPMAFKHFTPNFERARMFTFVHVHILDVRGRAPPATPKFGCARRSGKRPTYTSLREPYSPCENTGSYLAICTIESSIQNNLKCDHRIA